MKEFTQKFFEELSGSLHDTSWKDIAQAAKILHACYEQGGNIYIIGNGGSAAIASHFAGDLNKTVFGYKGDKKTRRFQAIAFSDNTPALTAWANDVGYEHVFSGQLQNFIQEKDVLFAISSSGNSQNIIRAVEVAKAHHIPVVALVGFGGGLLKKVADVSVLIDSNDYGVVESAHEAITHLFTRYFYNVIQDEKRAEEKKAIEKSEMNQEIMDSILELMKDVGHKLLQWRQEEIGLGVLKPMTKETVSFLDSRAEDVIKKGLIKILPDYNFFGEELGHSGKESKRTVLIDPIDGTKNYLAGSPLFATQIAGIEDGEIKWGVIYLPALDEIFWAVKDGGAYLSDARIHVSGEGNLDNALQCFGVGHDGKNIVELPSMLKSKLAEPRSLGSAGVHFAFVACGRLDLYIAREAAEYDSAPGIILCHEAGAKLHHFGKDRENLIIGSGQLVEQAKVLLA